MYTVELVGTVNETPLLNNKGPTNIALILPATIMLDVIVFGVPNAPERVKLPVLNTATFAIPPAATVTSPLATGIDTLEVPFTMDVPPLAEMPVNWLPLPMK
jgi:hypothetical protein